MIKRALVITTFFILHEAFFGLQQGVDKSLEYPLYLQYLFKTFLNFIFFACDNGGSEHSKAKESKRHLPEQKTHVRVDV